MSGVQTSLSLQDKLTGPLMKMMKAMDSTIKVMEKMDSTANSIDTKGLEKARKAIDNASADMTRLTSATGSAGDGAGKAASQQEKYNNAISGGLPGIGSMVTGLLAAVGAYKALNMAKSFLGDIFKRGFDFQVLKQQSSAAFTVFLGDAEKAKQYMDDMYSFALTTPFAFPDLLESSRNLIAFGIEAKNTFPIMQALGDTVAAVGGSNADMQNMADIFGVIQTQGRITAMEVNRLAKYGVNAYEMLGNAAGVSAMEMKKQITSGAVSSAQAITGLVEGMEKQFGGSMAGVKGTIIGTIDTFKSSMRNAGDKMLEDFIEPITRGISNFTELVKKIPTYLGPALDAFKPVIERLNEAFEEGRFDGFFRNLAMSLTIAATLMAAMAEGAIWVATVIDDYWPTVTLAFTLLITTLIPSAVVGLYNMGRAWLAAMGPIGWIILAITVLIGVIQAFGVKSETMLAYVGALFFTLGAQVWNVVANMWNIFAMFSEFLLNLFVDPTYAVEKLFYDMSKVVIDNMTSMAGSFDNVANALGNAFVNGANIAIGGINKVITAMNEIPGVKFGTISSLATGSGNVISNGLKNIANNLVAPTSKKNVNSVGRMELKSIPEAMKKGYAAGSAFQMPTLGGAATVDPYKAQGLDMLEGLLDGVPSNLKGGKGGSGGKGVNPTGGKLDSIGKIDDEISIADEDLKMLKELADIRSIQNFQTLQPNFTFGDMTIREDADIKKIISAIETYLKEEMDRSTEGVYA
ncbi:tape measure protein [Sporosarcina sp. CAU 1771]